MTAVSMVGTILLTKPPLLFPKEGTAFDTTPGAPFPKKKNSGKRICLSNFTDPTNTDYPHKAIAEIGAATIGLLQAMLYHIYSKFPDLHWSIWQLFNIPFTIPVTILLIALNGDLSDENVISEDYTVFDIIGVIVIAVLDLLGNTCRSLSAEVICPLRCAIVRRFLCRGFKSTQVTGRTKGIYD